MNKSDMIISIIIVLCIAAGVIAYGLTNSDNTIFSDLSSMGSGDNNGDGIGNNTTNGTGVGTGTGSSSGSGSSSSGSGSSGSGTGSSGGSGGSSGGSGSGSGGGSGGNSETVTYDEAISIANANIAQEGWHASTAYRSGDYWIVTIVDADGNRVDQMSINRYDRDALIDL